MLTSFFGKSKPVNFIMVSIYVIIGYFFWSIINLDEITTIQFLPKQLLILTAILFSVFLLNFIVKKNHLTENNTYSIFFLACFMLLLPEFFFNADIILSNILLMLAFRRILSFSSEKNIEKKILDASIWITTASFFYSWCILFFIVLFIAVFQRGSKNSKTILIPFVGFLSVGIIVTVINLLFNDKFLWFLDIDTSINFNFQEYDSISFIIPISVIFILLIWTFIQKLISASGILLKDKANFILLTLIIIISVVIILFTPNKNGSEFIYLMAPLAVFTANFVEKLSVFWIKESLLWLVLLLPI